MPQPPRTLLSRYGLALASVLLATAARLSLGPALGKTHRLSTFYAAVIFSSWLCGFGPALLALILGAIVALLLFMEPYSLDPANGLAESIGVILYFGVGTAIIAFGESTRVARLKLEEDVARQKETEERLHQKREWLRVTLASIGDGVIATDVSGRVTFLNPMAEAMTGWTEAEAVGIALDQLFVAVEDSTRQPVETLALRAIREQTAVTTACHDVLISRDGSERAIDESAAPIRDGAGNVSGAVLTFREVGEKRAAERAIEMKESLKTAILSTALDAIITIDHEGKVAEWNPAAERIFGYSRREAVSWPLAELIIPPSMRQAHGQGVVRYLASGESRLIGKRFEITAIRADGSELPVEMAITRIPIEGLPVFTAHIRDITERKLAEEESRRFKFISDHANDAHFLIDRNGRFLYVNEVACERLGYPEETLLTMLAMEVDSLYDLEKYQVLFDEVQEKRIAPFESIHRRIDGSTFPVELSVTGVRFADEPFLFAVARDISERKQSEIALRESEAQLREMAEAMPQVVWTSRPDGCIDYYNHRWSEFTGLPAGVMGDDCWRPVLHPDDLERTHERWYHHSVPTGEPFEIEYRFWDRQRGEYRWFLARALAARDGSGRVVKWYGTCTDIHDQKRAEEALRDADRRKNEFIAMLAHELRNPLAPILNALQLMKRPGENGEESEALRDMMERQVHNMTRLVDDLLDVSRIDSGKIGLQTQPVDLVTVAGHAIEAGRPFVERWQHELIVALPDEPIIVEADPTRLEQILDNLIANAAKYTDPGGRVWFSVSRDGDSAVVRVRDTGIGIDSAMLLRVFDLFVQVERRTDRSQGGLGIGLSLVKTLVEMHGGSVSVHSEGRGKGAEFIVRLPVASGTRALEEVPSEKPTAKKPAKLIRRRILVVDDNQDAADSLARILTRLYRQDVRVAYDGPTALHQATSFQPDVVLLDIGLPLMDGYEVARRLRAEPDFEKTVLVALTGWGQEQDRKRSKEAGFDHHLVKPVEVEVVQNLILTDDSIAR